MTAGVTSGDDFVGASRVGVVTDAERWDAAVRALGGHLLQTWRWGEFKARHGWQPKRLLVDDVTGPRAAAQVLFRYVGPLSIAYVPRGPLVRGEPEIELAKLTLALDRACHRGRAVACLCEPEQWPADPPAISSVWQATKTQIQPRRTIIVPVLADDDDQLAIMKPKTRYNVRLAERRGVSVRLGTNEDLPAFYRLLEETARRDAFGIHNPSYFADLLDVFGPDAALVLAEYDGQLAAAAVVARAYAQAVYLFGASSTALQRHMAAYLVQFEALRWARARGCSGYDLWGIPEEDEAPRDEGASQTLNVRQGMWGVYRFKLGFGGRIVAYPGTFERVYHPRLLAVARRLGAGAV